MPTTYIADGTGAYKAAKDIYVADATGAWKKTSAVYVADATGAWKKVHPPVTVISPSFTIVTSAYRSILGTTTTGYIRLIRGSCTPEPYSFSGHTLNAIYTTSPANTLELQLTGILPPTVFTSITLLGYTLLSSSAEFTYDTSATAYTMWKWTGVAPFASGASIPVIMI